MYAILSHGGRQFRVSAGDRLVVDRLEAEVGSVVALEPILLTSGDGEAGLGKDLEGMRVAVTVVAHTRGRKLRIFKYKAKKRSRKMAGYRSDLTELRVESILAKGAPLPTASATGASRATATAVVASAAPAPPARSARKAKASAAATDVVTSTSEADDDAAVTPRPRRRPANTKKADASSTGSAEAVDDAGVVDDDAPVAPKTRRRAARPPATETDDGS
jgi:large subunit ribosomal protein L21